MRIFHVIPSLSRTSGGPAHALAGFCRAVPETWSITVFSTLEGGEYIEDFSGFSNVVLKRFEYSGRHSFKISFALWMDFWKSLNNCDLVHTHAVFSPVADVCIFLALIKSKKVICRPLGTLSPWSLEYGNALFKKIYLFFFRLMSRKIRFHATSPGEKADLEALMPGATVFVVPLSTGLTVGNPKRSPQRPLRVGFLSRLDPKKNVEGLLQAAAPFLKSGEITLEIAGSGDELYERSLKKSVSDLGIQVGFTGFLSNGEKEAFFKRIDWFILPSFHENFGIAAVESLASGVPAILSNQVFLETDNSEAVLRCGVDVSSIRSAFQRVLTMEPESYAHLSSAAVKLVQEKFSNEAVRPKMIVLYQ